MTETIVTGTNAPVPTFLTWSANEAGALFLVREPLLTCPECHEPAGFLYTDSDSPKGACLGCKLGEQAVAQYEQREAQELGTPAATWNPRPKPGQIVCTECNCTRQEWLVEDAILPDGEPCCEG